MTDAVEHPEAAPQPKPAGLSLRDRIKARQQALEQRPEVQILVPIQPFEDLLAVRYRPLSFEEEIRFESRHQKLTSEPKTRAEGIALTAADKLVNACERLCERRDGKWHDTEYKLDARAARELFGCELSDDATARTATRAIFGDNENLVTHAAQYEELRSEARQGIEEELEGK